MKSEQEAMDDVKTKAKQERSGDKKDSIVYIITVDNNFEELHGLRMKLVSLLIVLLEKIARLEIEYTVRQVK